MRAILGKRTEDALALISKLNEDELLEKDKENRTVLSYALMTSCLDLRILEALMKKLDPNKLLEDESVQDKAAAWKKIIPKVTHPDLYKKIDELFTP